MLIAVAALGALSLKFNNSALKRIAPSRDGIIHQYQDVQINISRSMTSFVLNGDLLNNNIAQSLGLVEAVGDTTSALLMDTEKQMQSQKAFKDFKQRTEVQIDPESGYDQLVSTYDKLIEWYTDGG
jgi:hypothetical protein